MCLDAATGVQRGIGVSRAVPLRLHSSTSIAFARAAQVERRRAAHPCIRRGGGPHVRERSLTSSITFSLSQPCGILHNWV
eukprot:365399-Chlamydomonas_euryale.AAC.5